MFVLVDRIAIAPDLHQRLVDTVEICYREAGEVIFEKRRRRRSALRFNEKFPCKTCGMEFAEPEPSLFSFNSPFGACPRCQGFGNTIDYDMDLVIPDTYAVARRRRGRSVDQAAVRLVARQTSSKHAKGKVRFERPVLRADAQPSARSVCELIRALLRRPGKQEVQGARARVPEPVSRLRAVPGLPRRAAAQGGAVRARRRQEPRRRRAHEHRRGAGVLRPLELSPEETAIADKILVEIRQRLKFLNDVGLEYLTLDRLSVHAFGRRGAAHPARDLPRLAPGGRLLRARRAVDRPAHRDTARLIRILEELRELGNTIVVVEHDPDVMRAADHIVDLGPGAGEHGGHDRLRRLATEA